MPGSAIQQPEILDSAVAQMPYDALAGGACPEDQRALIAKPAQDLFGKFHAGKGHRNRVNSEACLATHPFAYLQGALEQAVQKAAGGAMIERATISGSHLAQDFGFPEQH